MADHSAEPNGDIGITQESKFDAFGNIVSMNVGATTKNYSYYTNTNRVKNVDGSATNSYVYDQIGNITSSAPKSINALTYDPFVNRTKTSTMSNSNQMQMGYDGTERRVYKKDVTGAVVREQLYLYDGASPVIEKDKSGATTEYVYGASGIFAVKSAATKTHLPSPVIQLLLVIKLQEIH